MKNLFYKIIGLSFMLLIFNSCSVYETFVNISRLQFKLGDVNNFTVNGINISNKSGLQDFTVMEALNLTTVFASGKLPVSFTLNVEAKNPNDGTGGYPKTDATLKSFPWRLEVDGKQTITGNIGSPISVPGTGELTLIPLTMEIDLLEYFNNRGYESLINLAFTLGGTEGSASQLTLYADPTITSPLGDIKYPNELKIVDHKFSN